MNDWLTTGTEPPPSTYPSLKQLVHAKELSFPAIPGVKAPIRLHTAYHVDYGPEFRTVGIIAKEPPVVGKPFNALAPAVDADGNEVAGLKPPELMHPLGTYTGWNYRPERIGAPNEMIAFIGSFFAFARTKAERGADPRLSIEERYSGKAEYIAKIGASARSLADRRLLLDRDVASLEERAARMWDALAAK